MMDPISLGITVGVGGGTWGIAYAWAKDQGMSNRDAILHANRVLDKVSGTLVTVGRCGNFALNVEGFIHNHSHNYDSNN